MKYCSIILLLIVLSTCLSGQSVDLKVRRLEYIQEQIEQKQKQVERATAEIENLSRDRDDFEHRFQTTQNKINRLSVREREISRSLDDSEKQMVSSQMSLEEISNLWQKQFYHFYLLQQSKKEPTQAIVDEHCFPIMITYTKERIEENREMIAYIAGMIEENKSSRQRVRREREQENRMINNYRKEISRLAGMIDDLAAEEQEILRELETLQQSRQNLENLITNLQDAKGDIRYSYEFTTSKLMWPLHGEVISTFGTKHDETYNISILSNGIDILVNEPLEVKAVDFGVVVFAEQFRSYGRLVIIDHQNGYFSLYGNNGRLLVTKDDMVSLGQTIAITGKMNHSDNYMLHFELRRHSTPVDPLVYLE